MRGERVASAMKTAVCAAVVAAGFSIAAAADDAHHHRHQHHHQTLPPAAGALSGNSLYQLESAWLNQDGAVQPLRALAGKPVVAAMIYTSCEFACPLIVRDMLAIQHALGGDGDVGDGEAGDTPTAQFVLFSFDPARDTPRAMRDYAAKKSLPAPQWELLAADDDATLELAVALGVRFQPVAGGDFAHSNIVFVLDCGGEIIHRQEGLNIPPAKAVAAIRTALADCG